ncbi:MAG: epoxyqueuosine reductase [Ruminococcaceae bacterium]|nr:epoxyqueuosine reductase [Oscillospiraceae bacterium]
MFEILLNFLQKKNIDLVGVLPLSDCNVTRPYLLERVNISSGTVFMMAIPYRTPACDDPKRSISAYAVSRDYHLFFAKLFDELLPYLAEKFPNNRFAAFADHSPISELHAAVHAGLGVIGKNGLLLTPKYGSYVFLGEVITDFEIPCRAHEVNFCEDCGACKNACPTALAEKNLCLSALSQKKGKLTEEEERILLSSNTVWGCDRCQECCPYNHRAMATGTIYSPIPFFYEKPISSPTTEEIKNMSDKDFSERAYSWRGRETILRNLRICEKGDTQC